MLKTLGMKIKGLFQGEGLGKDFYEELEDLLIEGDVGASTALRLVETLREEVRKQGIRSREDALKLFKQQIHSLLPAGSLPLRRDALNVFLLLGVNGVGKTTTIAKLAYYYRMVEGIKGIVFAAADTFRAGAIAQIETLADRLQVRVVKQMPGSDPGAVVYDALESARARGETLLLADTAGRMHNRTNLVRELQKIDKVITGKVDAYRKILVLDAVTGQNGLQQAKIFHDAVKIDSIILTKWDGTAKGGIILAIGGELGIPISFLGVGEKVTDLKPFDPTSFVENLLEGV
ncbi:MAG: signal recognition particle-docking protein FtsY [Spirochaetes bacterium]|nr:signal recognition particle-docking protein FtsY [Spirochaetota bacterium]